MLTTFTRVNTINTCETILLQILLCLTLQGCTFVPEQEQFVSSTNKQSQSRSIGNCAESALPIDGVSSAELDPEEISILGWNIYKGQRKNWDDDFLRFSREKDIIFLQEAPLNDQLQKVFHHKDLFWNMNSAFKFKGIETGVIVASIIPPFESCGLRRDEPVLGLPKTSLVSSFVITGANERLLAANIHGINFSLGTSAYRGQLNDLQKVLENHDGPIILAGDFNNWSKSRTSVLLTFAENLSLQMMIFNDEGRTTVFGDPVDHILYRGLEPVTNTVHRVTSSDHNPISATFRLARK